MFSRNHMHEPTIALLPNIGFFPMTHKGIVILTKTLVLQDVLGVPAFSINFLSISKLTNTKLLLFVY